MRNDQNAPNWVGVDFHLHVIVVVADSLSFFDRCDIRGERNQTQDLSARVNARNELRYKFL